MKNKAIYKSIFNALLMFIIFILFIVGFCFYYDYLHIPSTLWLSDLGSFVTQSESAWKSSEQVLKAKELRNSTAISSYVFCSENEEKRLSIFESPNLKYYIEFDNNRIIKFYFEDGKYITALSGDDINISNISALSRKEYYSNVYLLKKDKHITGCSEPITSGKNSVLGKNAKLGY